MKHRCWLCLGLTLAFGAVCRPIEDTPTQANKTPPEQPEASHRAHPLVDFATIANDLKPSVVSVLSTIHQTENTTGNLITHGIGSGMIVSSDGKILTNEHVVKNAIEVQIEFFDGQRESAKILYQEPLLDLALLQLENAISPAKPIQFRQDTPPLAGEWVMAVGQPFGLGYTVTVGVISGHDRDYNDLGHPAGLDPDGFWSFMQTDASINIGNSGGPLVDVYGKVVGITTAVRNDGQGLAFAIPAVMARKFIDEVQNHGRFRQARLGLRAENLDGRLTPFAPSGVRVTYVDPQGPSAQAGIQKNDLIVAINQNRIRRVSEISFQTQLVGVNGKLEVLIQRGDAPAFPLWVMATEASRQSNP